MVLFCSILFGLFVLLVLSASIHFHDFGKFFFKLILDVSFLFHFYFSKSTNSCKLK